MLLEKRKSAARIVIFVIMAAMALWLIPPDLQEVNAAATLKNPRVSSSGTTWDCVTFGSYPQAEVLSAELAQNYTALEKQLQTREGMVVSDSVYQALQKASGWDDNGDITLNGTKYRRIRYEDATKEYSDTLLYMYSPYRWPDKNTYHYFQYEPIKWRVLYVNGNQALLTSDVILDNQRYYSRPKGEIGDETDILTWERSSIRSWLNGYNAASNKSAMDYRSKNFIKSAFSKPEQDAIAATSVVNENNLTYGTEGGKDTEDKLFLLAESEVYGTEKAKDYGFAETDFRTKTRACKSSTYAKAMGLCSLTNTGADYHPGDEAYIGSGEWWLRSPGRNSDWAAYIDNRGSVYEHGVPATDPSGVGVRPALTLNLSSSQWSYAGTTGEKEGTVTPQPTITKPAAVSGLTLKAGKKQLTASWKKTASAAGYQAVIAQNSKFTKGKQVKTIKSGKTTKATFKKLKSKKTYYVKVRAYKKSGNKTVYGAYSKVKTIKVK